ncbi:ElyC/SanA/YdcF family protein [Arthrobacter sp. H41]|uniref:ElyC/SanA/YdcF family protein n=1 Tax=Arthrobacter sp. H41 TaxID=1312978 RepID=UPI0009DE136F
MCGLPASSRICFTPEPLTTRGEARSGSRLAQDNGWEKVIVVTSRYHSSRALPTFGSARTRPSPWRRPRRTWVLWNGCSGSSRSPWASRRPACGPRAPPCLNAMRHPEVRLPPGSSFSTPRHEALPVTNPRRINDHAR